MRFFRGSDLEIPVRWYFCADTAKPLPFYHRFGSGNWAKDKSNWEGPGEAAFRPRAWSDGEPPGPMRITLTSALALSTFDATNAPSTSTGSFRVLKDDVILVYISYFPVSGAHDVTSVTDPQGNLYHKDFTGFHPTESRVLLDVWRAQASATTNALTITVAFGGVNVYTTFGAASFQGLRNQHPLFTESATGTSPAKPSVTLPKTITGQSLVLVTYDSNGGNTFVAYPPGFTALGQVTSSGAHQDLSAAFKTFAHKTNNVSPAWDLTMTDRWIAAGLCYQAVGPVLPPGTSFCGGIERWQDGSYVSDSVPGSDQYGYSTCCGELPFQLTCADVTEFMKVQITGITNHGPTSLAFVGQVLDASEFASLAWAYSGNLVEIGGGFQGFVYFCGAIGMTWHDVDGGGQLVDNTSSRNFPPSWKFTQVKIFALASANAAERWDLTITRVPP